MNSIEVAKKVVEEQSALLFRRRKNNTVVNDKIVPDYDVKVQFGGKKKGWVYLDHFSASAIMACYNALSPENQKKAPQLSIISWVDFAFKHVK
jgi:hypothetical protein